MEKKLIKPVTLVVAIEAAQHEALRHMAFREKRSLAAITREALDSYIRSKQGQGFPDTLELAQEEAVKV